jgi:hypothetical protein
VTGPRPGRLTGGRAGARTDRGAAPDRAGGVEEGDMHRARETGRPARGRKQRAAAMVVAAAAVAGGACRPAGTGTAVAGDVVQSPGCGGPVVEGQPCPDRPVPGAGIDVLDPADVLVARARTDAGGRFQVGVPATAASYRIKVVLGDPPPAVPRCPNGRADVVAGQVAVVHIVCESGLR